VGGVGLGEAADGCTEAGAAAGGVTGAVFGDTAAEGAGDLLAGDCGAGDWGAVEGGVDDCVAKTFAAPAVAAVLEVATAAAFGAPTKPFGAPIFNISSQRGHGPEAAPFKARSITMRAIFSTTCSK
jgi:hypothetical protein